MCGVSSLKRLTTKDGGNAGFAGAKTCLFQKPDRFQFVFGQWVST